MVRDNGERTMLFDFYMSIQRIGDEALDHPYVTQLTSVYYDLLCR